MEILLDYLGEIILIVGIGFLKLFGREESAEKLKKRLSKRKVKLEKRLNKDSKRVQLELDELRKLGEDLNDKSS